MGNLKPFATFPFQIDHMISLIHQTFLKLVNPNIPKCRFKIGEVVTVDDLDYPLIVTDVMASLKKSDPLLSCKWFDRAARETRTKLIHESKLRPYDWSLRYSKIN